MRPGASPARRQGSAAPVGNESAQGPRTGRPVPAGIRKESMMPASSGLQFLTWLVVMGLGFVVGLVAAAVPQVGLLAAGAIWVFTFIVAWLAASAVRVAREWERAVVLRLGKFTG